MADVNSTEKMNEKSTFLRTAVVIPNTYYVGKRGTVTSPVVASVRSEVIRVEPQSCFLILFSILEQENYVYSGV